MGRVTFSGALENISEQHLEYIRGVINNLGYNVEEAQVENVGIAGDNYIANLKRFIVEDENSTLKIIAKIAPVNDLIREPTNMKLLFSNEHCMYTELLPKFKELEERAGIPSEDRYRSPVCYGSQTDAPYEVILLEDLQTSGFKMLNRFQPLPNECIKSTLKNFAKFHALSFVLKNKEPETFSTIKNKLFDAWSSLEGNAEMFFGKMETGAEDLVRGEERKRAVKNTITNSVSISANIAKTEKDSKHFVILHGDSWTNNIMFKFDGEQLQESILIDYQVSREHSPVCDIQYLIFNSTDHKSRCQHYNEWLDYYHTELDEYLSNFGMKANYIYSRDKLDADMKRYAKVMLGFSVMLASALSLKSDEAEKMRAEMGNKTIEELTDAYEVNQFGTDHLSSFRERLEGVVDSYLEFGLL